MNKINRETAQAEIDSWLDKKKIFSETRERFKDHIDLLVEAIMNETLILDSNTFELTHKLLFPLGDDSAGIIELKYRSRANDNLIQPHMRGVKSDDVDGRLNGLIAALTAQSRSIISKLDSVDKRIATAIGIFFM